MYKRIKFPLKEDLKVGEWVKVSGIVYTIRDLAHKRIVEYLNKGKNLPFNLKVWQYFMLGQLPKEKKFFP